MIGELLKRLNEERPIRRLGVTRRQLLEELDRPALKPLPTEPYVFAEWRVRRVGIDYHVDVEGHFYSVPYRFARSEVEVRLTGRTVEILVKGERIAVHHAGVERQAHHRRRPHAIQSSPLRRLDHRPHPQRCCPFASIPLFPAQSSASRSLATALLGARSLAACCAQARGSRVAPVPRIDHPTT